MQRCVWRQKRVAIGNLFPFMLHPMRKLESLSQHERAEKTRQRAGRIGYVRVCGFDQNEDRQLEVRSSMDLSRIRHQERM